MSASGLPGDGAEAMEHLEQQRIIDNATADPDLSLDENAALLGHSKRQFPKRLIMLIVIVITYAISSISTMPAGMDMTYQFICYFLNIESSQCLGSDIAGERVANFSAVSSVIRGILNLFVTTYLSALSDRIGRKPLLFGAMCLTGISHISAWYIFFRIPNPSTYWLLITPLVIDCVGGSIPLVVNMCIAYICDMVPDASQRTRLLAVVDGAFFASLALGPTIGSWVIRLYGVETLYIATTVGAFFSATISFIFLKESLSNFKKRRNSTNKQSAKGVLSLIKFESVTDPKSKFNARVVLVLAMFGTELLNSFLPVLLLYPKRVFGWTGVESGYLVSAMASTRTFWFLIGFPFLYSQLSKVWHVNPHQVDKIDLTVLRIGIFFIFVGHFSMGLSRLPSQYFASGIVDAFSSIGMPIFKSALIKYVPAGQFGTFMAGFNFASSCVSIIGPPAFLKIYSWAISWRPYLPFELIGSMFFCLFLVTFVLKPVSGEA